MFTHHVHRVVRYLICLIHSFKGFYGRFKYSKDIADSLKSIFTNINTERISEILVGVVLCLLVLSLPVLFQIHLLEPLAHVLMLTSVWYGAAVFSILFSYSSL